MSKQQAQSPPGVEMLSEDILRTRESGRHARDEIDKLLRSTGQESHSSSEDGRTGDDSAARARRGTMMAATNVPLVSLVSISSESSNDNNSSHNSSHNSMQQKETDAQNESTGQTAHPVMDRITGNSLQRKNTMDAAQFTPVPLEPVLEGQGTTRRSTMNAAMSMPLSNAAKKEKVGKGNYC